MATNVSRYQPQGNVTRLPDLVDRLFRESFVMPGILDRSANGMARPSLPVNLFETPESFVFQACLPGVKPENLDIQVTGRELALRGQVEMSAPENGGWIWQGIPAGEFFEAFTLPIDVNSDGIQASYDYGILSVVLPKAEHVRPKSIKVNVGK